MRIFVSHNYYQQPGGEDHSFADEVTMLESQGHDVLSYTLHNDEIDEMSGWRVATKTLWNSQTFREVESQIADFRPDVMHCTNTFPLVSPAIYYAAARQGVPVVQSLRNFRMMCVNGLLMREGQICEKCLGTRTRWPSVVHGCYRNNRPASGVVASMLTGHRMLGTWQKKIDVYYALTQFARQKFIDDGLPADRMMVKPNFVLDDPGVGQGAGDYALYVGRLSPEKGIENLLEAWSLHDEPVRLVLAGDGDLAPLVQDAAAKDPRIEFLGWQPREQISELIADARCVIMPSIWYEGFGRIIIEAYAHGTPAIVSRLGSMGELIRDGVTGERFTPGDSQDLARTFLDAHKTGRLEQMRPAARQEYLDRYTTDTNYRLLMSIYDRALHPEKFTTQDASQSPAPPDR